MDCHDMRQCIQELESRKGDSGPINNYRRLSKGENYGNLTQERGAEDGIGAQI